MDSVWIWTGQAFREQALDDWYAPECGPWSFRPGFTHRDMAELVPDLVEAMTIAPAAQAALGPVLTGPGGAQVMGKHIPGWGCLVAYCGQNPVATLYHELHHWIWPRLRAEDRALLREHGDAIRDAATGAERTAWLLQAEEAEGLAFEYWAVGKLPPASVRPPAAVLEVWRATKSGHYANSPRTGF